MSAISRWTCSLVYWAASVGVMQQRVGLAAPPDRHHQGIGDELCGHGSAHRPADHTAREQIDDALAMRTLFARHKVRLFRFLVRIVRDQTLAEDLVSDVFLDVWRKAEQFEGRSSVSTWLLAIGRLKALSALRRRTDVELDDQMASIIEDPADDPETVLEKKNSGDVLRRCVTALSPAHCQSSIWCTTMRNLWAKSPRSSVSRRRPSRRECSMRAGNWLPLSRSRKRRNADQNASFDAAIGHLFQGGPCGDFSIVRWGMGTQ